MATEKDVKTTQLDFHKEMLEVEMAEKERKKTYSADGTKAKDKKEWKRCL